MRLALQRSLASPSSWRLTPRCNPSDRCPSIEAVFRDGKKSRRSSAVARPVGRDRSGRSPSSSEPIASEKTETNFTPGRVLTCPSGELERHTQLDHAGTLDQDEQRTKAIQLNPTRFVKYEHDATNWFEVLETVRERRRRGLVYDAEMVYKNIIQDELDMPTKGAVATELWDHFIQVSNKKPNSLLRVAEYAIRLQQRTGRAPIRLYGRLMEQDIVWRSLSLALSLHQVLKADFPPTSTDYGNVLRISLRGGRKSMAIFESVYKDFPVPSMYPVVVPMLCMLGMYTEAAEWHHLLLTNNDLPKSFRDCKPLIEYYAYYENDKAVEDLVLSLAQRQVWFEKDMNQFVRNDKTVSREIMNRALGEVHGIAPKTLSDDFCARVFATKLFSIDLAISGLQAIGVQTLGPASLRELVVRSEHNCKDVVYHINRLKEAGIPLLPCKFNSMVRKAAFEGQSKLLKSIADTDLHPDTFEDINLQERLLATYCEKDDLAQMERTLAIIESTVPEKSLKMQRANLLLRCHVSIGNRVKVLSILESMQRNQYPLTPRSSRHLRRAYLGPRRKGFRPSERHQEMQNLALIINVMKMTLESGAFVPLVSWREILRRLGMMGHLARYQSLALWIVDWYAKLPGYTTPYSFEHANIRPHRLLSSTTQSLLSPPQAENHSDLTNLRASKNNAVIQHNNFLVLFGKQAQQGIIAWGFQAEVKKRPQLPKSEIMQGPDPSTHWQWGLKLLKELQSRGVIIETAAVARACKLRLAQLFNDGTTSNKITNRRAKDLNDLRSTLMAKCRYSAYVRGMEEIWGPGLFRPWDRSLAPRQVGEHTYHGSNGRGWRVFQHEKRTGSLQQVN